METIDKLAEAMDAHGIKRCVRYPVSGYCHVELHNGRHGTADTFANALRAAQEAPAERWAA